MKKILFLVLVLILSGLIIPCKSYSIETNTKINSDHNKFCPNCGVKIIPGHGFCSECGYNLTKSFSSPSIKMHTLTLGLKYYHYDYREIVEPPFKSTENGWLPGIFIDYSFQGIKFPIYFRLTGEYTYGNTKYDGSTQSGEPLTGETGNSLINFSTHFGFVLRIVNNTFYINPYSGIGYHFWHRGGLDEGFYGEDYSWCYVPVGIRPVFRITDRFTFAMDVSARFMFKGKIKVFLTDLSPDFNEPEGTLGNETGFKIESSVSYIFKSNIGISFTPWYEYSAIGESDIFELTYQGVLWGYGYEPSSKTDQYGLDIGFLLYF
ncbi:MAG: zinc ribbon domain-containing protein [Spirochaetes bacterium]|nr:zinc ribbon domain-containing protein [Spirochaetota bacterium]